MTIAGVQVPWGGAVCLTPDMDVQYTERNSTCLGADCNEGNCEYRTCQLRKWVLSFFEWNDAFESLTGDDTPYVDLQLLYDGRAFNTTTIANPAAGEYGQSPRVCVERDPLRVSRACRAVPMRARR